MSAVPLSDRRSITYFVGCPSHPHPSFLSRMHNTNPRWIGRARLVTFWIGCAVVAPLLGAAPVRAQDPPRVEAARRLMEEGALSAASDSLRAHLRVDPENATAHWLLGRVLYWMGRGPEALDEYGEALSILPNEGWLRVEYAEVLMALGEHRRAREVLQDVRGETNSPAVEAEALVLLGTLAYWEGDYTLAVRRFETALERDPEHGSARTQLDEIRGLTRPWIRAALDLLSDNQPYRRYRGTLEAGAYATPLWTVYAAVVPRVLEAESPASAVAAWGGADGYVPALRLELSGSLGVWLAGADQGDPAWIGAGAVGFRLPGALSLRAEASRRRYLATRASADTLLMVRTLDLRLSRAAAPDWAGEGVARVERFPDGNLVRTFYIWLLAPVQPWLRLGYSGAWQDADESRWVPASGVTGEGRYDPYFTPEQIRVHAALGELLIPLGATDLRINGSYGFHALEMAPAPADATPGPQPGPRPAPGPRPPPGDIQFVERGYSPWRLRAEAALPIADRMTLRLGGARERTSYYELDHLSLEVRYTFARSGSRP